MRRPEGDLDPVITDPLLPDAITPLTLVINSLVYHVPFLDPAFPMGNDLGDIPFQNLNGFFPRIFLILEPPGILAMPSQGMTADHHPVLFCKFNDGVSRGEIIRMLTPTDSTPLHVILRHHGVKFAFKYLDVLRVSQIAFTNRCADIKIELFREFRQVRRGSIFYWFVIVIATPAPGHPSEQRCCKNHYQNTPQEPSSQQKNISSFFCC